MMSLYADFQSRIYGFDGMFPRTLKDLTLHPGAVVRAFVSGNRVRYVGPAGYFFLMITTFLLLMSMLGVSFGEFMNAMNSFAQEQSVGQQEMSNQMGSMMNEYLRLFSFFIALLLVVSTWMFFRKSGFNFLEHAVVVFYSNGHMMWLSIIMLLAYTFTGVTVNAFVMIALSMLYFMFMCVRTYQYQSAVKVAIKSFIAFIVAYVFYVFIFSIGFLIYLFNHPEMMDKFRSVNP